MNNTNQLLYQFAEDYGQNQEMKNLAFIKLAAAIQGHISSLEPAILEIISGDNDLVRQNLIYFIKLVTCLDYFDFKSGFIEKVFQILVRLAKNNIHSDQFQIVCLMLIRKEIQQKYLAFLMQLISQNEQDEVNFSLCVLEQLLFDVLEIMEGRKKGPKISPQMINDLCEKSFKELKKNLQFYNMVDKQNFFLICQHSLCLIRKFYTGKLISDLQIYENIWNHGIFNCENENSKVINPIFGILVEFCSFRENNIKNIQKSQNFNQIIRCSQIFILKCEQINKFWHAYLAKRKNLLFEPINNLDSVAIAVLFSDCFFHFSQSIEQIQQKLTVVDNYILLNEVMVKMKSIDHIQDLRKQLNQNPQMHGIQEIMLDSFEALYSPIFRIKQKSSFFQAVLEIKNITRYLINNPQVNRLQVCKKFLNILPSLKIIFVKCRDVVTKQECIQTLVQFLFLFLGIDNPKCFQHLIDIICNQFLEEIKQIQVDKKDKMRILNTRVDKIIYSSIGVLQAEGINRKNISSYVKCINSLIKIIFRKQSIQISNYIEKLLKIVEIRNIFYDQQLHKLISFLIKSMPKTQYAINTFQCLRKVIIDNSNLPYLQLMFDFAETHYTNPQIMQSMAFCNNKIVEMCFTSPEAQILLRNISYNVMIQSVRGNLDTFKSVIKGISYIAKQPSFKPKVYKRLIEILTNQREKLELFVREQKNLLLKVSEMILVLVEMMRKIVSTLEENNQAPKAQKSEICEKIASEIFQLCNIFYKEFKNSSVEVYGVINQIRGVLNSQSLKNLPNILTTTKLLMTSHTLLQTQLVVPSGDQNYNEFYKSIKILKAEQPKKQLKIQDHLFIWSVCNKFMNAKLVNQANHN